MSPLFRFLRLKYIGRVTWFRNYIYSLLFGAFGTSSSVGGPIVVKNPQNIFIGDNTSIDTGCVLNGRNMIMIGNDVSMSVNVVINTGGLDYTKKGSQRAQHISAGVTIEDGVWLASGCIINAGVTIGKNSVIGAGAVVTKSIPQNVVAVGVPAQVIKNI